MTRTRPAALRHAAVRLAVRIGLRRVWPSALVLAALFGVVAGVAGASLATADRIETAYDELVREVDAPNAFGGCFTCESEEQIAAFMDGLRGDAAVADAVAITQIDPVLRTATGELIGQSNLECVTPLTIISTDWPTGPPARIVDGRFANEGLEIALPLITARRAGVEVGDRLYLHEVCFSYGALAEPVELEVVGIFVGFLDVRPPGQAVSFENGLVVSGFATAAGIEDFGGLFALWLHPNRTVDDLEPAHAESVIFELSSHAAENRSYLRPDATALRLFAALLLIAAVAVLWQLLARHVRATATNHARLRSLGARPSELTAIGLAHGAAVGIGAGITAIAATAVATPLIPLGAADYARTGASQPLPWTTALVAGAVIASAVSLLAVGPSLMVARAHRSVTEPRPSLAGRVASALHLPATSAWGMRVAFESRVREQRAPLRGGLGAAVLATAVVAGVITFAASLDHLRSTPRLVGWNWDVVVDNDETPPLMPQVEAMLATHRDVERWSWGNSNAGLAVGPSPEDELTYLSFSTGPRAVQPVVISGRAPESADEILLSTELTERLDIGVGDVIDITVENWVGVLAQQLDVVSDHGVDREFPFELVGIGVVPVAAEFGTGAALTVAGVERLYAPPTRADLIAVLEAADRSPGGPFDMLIEGLAQENPDAAEQLRAAGTHGLAATIEGWSDDLWAEIVPRPQFSRLTIDLVDGATPTAILAALKSFGIGNNDFGVEGVVDGRLASTTEVVQLDLEDVDWLPSALGIVMSITAFAVVAHLIATGARSRRRDLATLQALGFSRRQVRAVVLWQGFAMAIAAGAIALPVGTIAGRLIWQRYAEGINVVPEPLTPWLILAGLLIVSTLLAVAAAGLPAIAAGRRHPIDSLHSE